MEESLAAFRDEGKENRQPEGQGGRRFNSGVLDAEIKILPAPGQRRGISLDIPFYRPWRQGRTYFSRNALGMLAGSVVMRGFPNRYAGRTLLVSAKGFFGPNPAKRTLGIFSERAVACRSVPALDSTTATMLLILPTTRALANPVSTTCFMLAPELTQGAGACVNSNTRTRGSSTVHGYRSRRGRSGARHLRQYRGCGRGTHRFGNRASLYSPPFDQCACSNE
jgi:hypothetical protein